MQRSSVVLPLPLGPRMASSSPSPTSSETSSRARTSWPGSGRKLFRSPATAILGSSSPRVRGDVGVGGFVAIPGELSELDTGFLSSRRLLRASAQADQRQHLRPGRDCLVDGGRLVAGSKRNRAGNIEHGGADVLALRVLPQFGQRVVE